MRAEEDLRAAETLLRDPDLPSYGTVSFHAQQAAEKALKTLLVRHGLEIERTHDLGRLLDRLDSVAPDLRRRVGEVDTLTIHAVATRYPMTLPSPGREEATRHLELVRRVVEETRALLADYLDAEPSAT